MSWWQRLVKHKDEAKAPRLIARPDVDTTSVTQVKRSSTRHLNERDLEAVKKIEDELLKAGFLAPRGEAIEITERLEDILRVANSQGLENVNDLVGDFDLNELLSSHDGGANFLLDDFDEEEDAVYDVYDDNEPLDSTLSVEAEGSDGAIALRLPDGTTIYGRIPGQK